MTAVGILVLSYIGMAADTILGCPTRWSSSRVNVHIDVDVGDALRSLCIGMSFRSIFDFPCVGIVIESTLRNSY